jgi:hypothetical protein
MSGNSIFQGAAYANGCVTETGNGGLEGPATADGYSISGNGTFYQPLGTNSLPPGAPANSQTTSTNVQTVATSTYQTTGIFTTPTTVTSSSTAGYWGQIAKSWRQLK